MSEIGTRCRPGWMQKSFFIQNWVESQDIRNTKYRTEGKREVKPVTMNTPESRKWPNSADVDSGCAQAQITYKHQDETQIIALQETHQNPDKQNK